MTIIGIDLGTSNSAAAVLRGGRPVIIPSAEGLSIGGKAFPSYVALTADGQMLIGEPARRQATVNPEGAVTAFKRKMGKRETIVLRGRDHSPEQLSAFLLQKIKRDAEAFLGEPVHKAVVTVAERFQMATGVDVRTDRKAAARLMEAAEAAKIDLTASVSVSAHVSLPYLAAVQGEPRHLERDLNRTELERLVRPVIERCRAPVEQALHDAGITPKQVDRVVFVGGPTRMPAVRAFFEEMFGHKAEMGVDPMECVAAGAAIQAGVLAGEVGGIVLVDVTPLTLGVETLGGIATSLIARNTPIPVKRTELFTTAADMQTNVTVHVFQGERPMASDNTSLGEFTLDGLPPAPRGVPKIEVTFDIDSNGILSVAARDTASGKSQSISVTSSTRLPESEKKRMVEDAERYADADKKRRDDAEKLNAADGTCYEAEKLLANFADKLTDELKKRLEASLRETKDALLKKDVAQATDRAEALKKLLKEADATLYTQSGQAQKRGPYAETRWQGPTPQPPAGAQANPSGDGPRGKVMDAEYRENKQK